MDSKVCSVSDSVDKNVKVTADLDQALSIAGVGWYNLKYAMVLAFFLMAAIIEPTGYAYVLPTAKCDLQMTDSQRGFLASVPYIGIVLTSYPWGYLLDTLGRKRIAVYSAYAAGFFGVLSAFMPELISFVICKFIMSLCIAGPSAVPYTFVGEIIPQKHRDLVLSIVNAMQISGAAVVPLLAWAILPLDINIDFGMYYFRSWRVLVILNAATFILCAFLLSFGPESPKYLVTQGKNDEALRVLQTIYAGNKGKSPDQYPVQELRVPDKKMDTKIGFVKSLRDQSLPLLKPPYVKWLALLGFMLFGTYAILNGLYVWVPDILNRVLTGHSGSSTVCAIIGQRLNETIIVADCNDRIERTTFVINSIANACCAIVGLIGASSVKLIGKKALLVVSFWIIGSFAILVNFITYDIVFVILLSSFASLGLAIGPTNAYAVEIFPTELRGMAVSLAMMIGRSGSIVGANVAGVLINVNCEATFYLFGGLVVVCGFLVFVLPKSRQTKKKAIKNDLTTTRL